MTLPINESKSKIFVDGNCIVCDFEISHYKRLAPDKFDIVDISAAEFQAPTFGLSPESVQKHMHVMTPDGHVVKGVDAFAHIWSRIPKYRFAAKAIAWPVVHPLAEVGYEIFARVRPWLPKKRRG